MGNLLLWLQEHIKPWTKPATPTLISGMLSDWPRTRADLLVENALLRPPWMVLNRELQRPPLTHSDRFRVVVLAPFTKFWKQSMPIIQPDTLWGWHGERFRFSGRRKSPGKPKISTETIARIRKMAAENDLGGAERIRGELLKRGIEVSKRTVQKYLPKERKSQAASQGWATFLKNQASARWAGDFTVA